jgi:hypothetical protein
MVEPSNALPQVLSREYKPPRKIKSSPLPF